MLIYYLAVNYWSSATNNSINIVACPNKVMLIQEEPCIALNNNIMADQQRYFYHYFPIIGPVLSCFYSLLRMNMLLTKMDVDSDSRC